jgi:hypothetical protein
MSTIDMAAAGLGRWLTRTAEVRARRRTPAVAWTRLLRGLLQLVGLGFFDVAAWTLGRTVGYIAIGATFILVSAMITGQGKEPR